MGYGTFSCCQTSLSYYLYHDQFDVEHCEPHRKIEKFSQEFDL